MPISVTTPTNFGAWSQAIDCISAQTLQLLLGQNKHKILLILIVLYLWLTYSTSIQCLLHNCRFAWPAQDSIHSHTYLTHTLIRCRLRPGREHALNKQYAVNSKVCLITRVYSTLVHDIVLLDWAWVSITIVVSEYCCTHAFYAHADYLIAWLLQVAGP